MEKAKINKIAYNLLVTLDDLGITSTDRDAANFVDGLKWYSLLYKLYADKDI